ncbi:MAG: rhomboid family intramembrane serine protease [Chloroflexota bacterium]
MIPFEDRTLSREEQRAPVAVFALLATNVAVFLYMLTLGPQQVEAFVQTYGLVPARLTGLGAASQPGGIPAQLTIITSLFIHGGLLHLFGNMLFLWVFGDNVESALGHATFVFLYFTAGILASLAYVAVFPTSTAPIIGASGAIAGVLGSYLLLYPQAQVRVLLFFGPFFALGRITALLIIFGWFVLQVFRGFGSLLPSSAEGAGIAYLAHVGGFVVGLALTAGIRYVRHQPIGRFRGNYRVGWTFRNWLIAAVALGGVLALGAALGGAIGATIHTVALGLAALLAIADGALRATGRHALLGEGRGAGRFLAVVQIIGAVTILIVAVLP